MFLSMYTDNSPVVCTNSECIIDTEEGSMNFTSKWLLKQVLVHLPHHLLPKCVHKRYGTVLYPKNGDLLTCLSWALGRSVNCADIEVTYKHLSTKNSDNVVLTKAGDIVNDLVQKEIHKQSQFDADSLEQNVKHLDINEQIQKTDEQLWTFIKSITRTRTERGSGKTSLSNAKDFRRFNILCGILFCTNMRVPTPLHRLLSDTVEMCGGSRVLIKILNRLGIVTSSDTHDGFVTQVARSQRQRTVWNYLQPDVFTPASVDNFDMLQSHAAVYCGDQSRSYHGTTIQLFQNQPSPHNKIENITNIEESSIRSSRECTREETTCEFHSHEVSADVPSLSASLITKKRSHSNSPACSPHKLGKKGPKRRRTLAPRTLQQQLSASMRDVTVSYVSEQASHQLCLNDFIENSDECRERDKVEKKMYSYIFAKQVMPCTNTDSSFTEFKQLYAIGTDETTSPSSIYYMELVDEHPDSKETMRYVSEMLLHTYNTPRQSGYVLLTGDGKTYEHLMDVKRLYGDALKKLLIFPGDWHTLANFQPVLMKVYYHAGLKEIAQSTGFRGETLTSLEKCGNFKRTHNFLIQVWQAIYRVMLDGFCQNQTCMPDLQQVRIDATTDSLLILNLSEMIPEGYEKVDHALFRKYVSKMAAIDSTWKFWEQFVFHDCLAYIMLHLGVRCSNWTLRVAALKLMAPLFVAYDRKTYQKLVPNHLADIKKYPLSVLHCLKKGFTVSLSGKKGHNVAIDEAHEMCVNKDMKMAIVRPNTTYLQKTSLFMCYRIAAHRNLLKQLFSPSDENENTISLFDLSAETKKKEENIKKMIAVIHEHHMLSSVTTDRGLINVYTNVQATAEIQKDMLTFREIGLEHLKLYVQYHILKTGSKSTPVRQHKLLTMAPKKQGKRLINQKVTEMKQVTKCLRQRLSWCNRTGQTYDPTQEQYSIFPRAIADDKGCPRKGVKSIWKEKIGKKYQHSEVVTNDLPSNWVPHTIVFDGMFLINCKPLRTTKTISDYAIFLHNRFFVPHYRNNAKEIHFVFDAPKHQPFNPKMFEQEHRDQGHASNATHQHIIFTPTTQPPAKWREFLECRKCKRSIIEAITLACLQSIRFKLKPHQKMIIAGSYSAHHPPCYISGDGSLPTTAPQYQSTAEEADLRVWRHVQQSNATTVLVYSPDTDIYNIGLTTPLEEKKVIVQVNVPQSTTQLYINLCKLISSLEDDLDVATINKCYLRRVFQMLYICSGCDYVSYFAGIGKAMFFNVFFQHASFVTGSGMPGELSFSTVGTIDENFLSFLRLVGTMYFKKHFSAMVSLRGTETPQQLLNSKESMGRNIAKQHDNWYDDIRSIVSDRITNEEDRTPSRTSMWQHWLRSCWVAQLYQDAHLQDPYSRLQPPEQSGWKVSNGQYSVDWECPELQHQIQETIDFLMKGGSCKKGCTTMRCSCVKKGSRCGPGCTCRDCRNINVPDEQEVSTDSDSESSNSDTDNIQMEVVTGLEYEYDDLIDMQL